MPHTPLSVPRARPRYRGSALLASAPARVLRVLPVVLGVWLLCGWALEWW